MARPPSLMLKLSRQQRHICRLSRTLTSEVLHVNKSLALVKLDGHALILASSICR